MSDRKTSEELEFEMDQLVRRMGTLGLQLQETRRRESHIQSRESVSEQEQYKALLRKMVGRRIVITKKDDPLCGMEAVITGPRGKSKKPMYWWFRTTTGIEAYKAKTSFKLLPLESTSEEA